jgi:hypothetical protein
MTKTTRAFMAALGACAFLAALGLAEDKLVESLWQSGPMTIDGVAQEWDASTPIVDEASTVQYAFRNDSRNLYVIMVFRSPEPGGRTVSPRGNTALRPGIYPKSTLDYTGMKIYFTTGAKASKDFGILFQKKMFTASALIASMEKRGQVLSEQEKAEIRKKPTHIVFTEEVIRPKKADVPAERGGDFDAPMFRAIDKGSLSVCEFRIPLNRVKELGGIDAKPGQTIKVGFEWGGMTSQIMRDMMAGRADQSVSAGDRGVSSDSGFSSSAGGDDAGGEIRGMGGGVGEMGRNPRYAKHSFWVEAKLAAAGN